MIQTYNFVRAFTNSVPCWLITFQYYDKALLLTFYQILEILLFACFYYFENLNFSDLENIVVVDFLGDENKSFRLRGRKRKGNFKRYMCAISFGVVLFLFYFERCSQQSFHVISLVII